MVTCGRMVLGLRLETLTLDIPCTSAMHEPPGLSMNKIEFGAGTFVAGILGDVSMPSP